MENIAEAINSLWKIKLIADSFNVIKTIVAFLPLALFLYKPTREYIYYHFTGTMVKILVIIFLIVPISTRITNTYLNFQISKRVIEINRKLPENERWLMRIFEKDAIEKLEKLEIMSHYLIGAHKKSDLLTK